MRYADAGIVEPEFEPPEPDPTEYDEDRAFEEYRDRCADEGIDWRTGV